MSEFKADIRPSEYMKEGLFNDGGDLREGINGEFSLSVAYQLRDDGYKPAELLEYRERIGVAVESFFGSGEEAGSAVIPDGARAALRECADRLREDCELAGELVVTAEPQLTDWRSFGLFMDHLERINAQLALVSR